MGVDVAEVRRKAVERGAISAEQAERMGLIWACVDDAALADQTMALAQRLAAMPVKALAATRRVIDEAIMVSYADALSLEARVQNDMGAQADFREGVAAFLDKRAAQRSLSALSFRSAGDG
jgi:2-(1,2-epoxy-1,2-dihydrophenyl)acetyl-CoA isomerase